MNLSLRKNLDVLICYFGGFLGLLIQVIFNFIELPNNHLFGVSALAFSCGNMIWVGKIVKVLNDGKGKGVN